MRKREYIPLKHSFQDNEDAETKPISLYDRKFPIPMCHNIVSTSQIVTSTGKLDLQRISMLLPNTRYDRKRFAAITIRIDNPTCTGLLFSSGKLVVTGSVSLYACLLASHSVTELLRNSDPTTNFQITSCVIQNIVAHAEINPDEIIDIDHFYEMYCEYAT